MQVPAEMQAEEQEALGKLVETLADHDDVLLEKVLEDVKPTPEELYRDLHKDLLAGSVIEVLLGSADNANGVRRLWKALRHDAPSVRGDGRTQGDRGGGAAAGAGLQDRACRSHRQAVLRPHLARRDQGRRHARRHAAGRHLSPGRRRAEQGGGCAGRRRGRARPAGRRADRCHGVARRHAGPAAVPGRAAAGVLAGDRHHGSQGRRETVRRAAEAAGGRPGTDRGAKPGHRGDRAAWPGRDAPERRGAAAGEQLQPEGHHA